MDFYNDLLEGVYHQCRKQLYACALSVTHNPVLAEDAIQEAFSRLFRIKQVPDNLKAYVFRTVRNTAIDSIRHNSNRNEEIQDVFFEPSCNPFETAEQKDFQQRIDIILQTLSKDEKETIISHLYADLPFREIAEIREVPLGTVTAWYRRGMEKLRERLEAYQ